MIYIFKSPRIRNKNQMIVCLRCILNKSYVSVKSINSCYVFMYDNKVKTLPRPFLRSD